MSGRERPDLLFTNGRIVTCDPARPMARAVAVRAGRIVAVGDDAAARAEADPTLEPIHLGGRTMVPGFIDAHNHMACTAETFFAVDASPRAISSIAELATALAEAAGRTPPGGWVRGFGMDFTKLA